MHNTVSRTGAFGDNPKWAWETATRALAECLCLAMCFLTHTFEREYAGSSGCLGAICSVVRLVLDCLVCQPQTAN